MIWAFLNNLRDVPRATVHGLRSRGLITVTRENPGGVPYIKTILGDRVTNYLKRKGQT